MSRSAHAVTTDPRTPSCVSCHGPSQSHAVKEKGKKQGTPDRVLRRRIGAARGRAQRRVPELPQQRLQARVVGRQPAPDHRRGLQHLPQGARQQGRGAEQGHADRGLLRLPQGAARADQPAVAPSDPGGEDELLRLPQRARLGRAEAGASATTPTTPATPAMPKSAAPSCTSISRSPTTARIATTRTAARCRRCWWRARRCCASNATRRTWPAAWARWAASPVCSRRRCRRSLRRPSRGTSSGKNVVNIWQARSCTNCHTQVHGSNNPSTTNPTPQFMFR